MNGAPRGGPTARVVELLARGPLAPPRVRSHARRDDADLDGVVSTKLDAPTAHRGTRRVVRTLAPWWPAAYFSVLTGVLFWPLLTGRSSNVVPGIQSQIWPWRGVSGTAAATFPQRDGAVSTFPWSVTYHEAISRGAFPFWDWHSFLGGYDLSSDGVAGVMYPAHWLVWAVAGPAPAHDLFAALHFLLGGLAMYALLRHWRAGALAALVGATVWILCAFNVVWLQGEMLTPILLVVPILFLAVERLVDRVRVDAILLLSVVIAIALVAGNLPVFLLVLCVVAGYALLRVGVDWVRRRDARLLGARCASLAVAAGIGLLLSGYSIVPTLRYLGSVGRQPATLSSAAASTVAVREAIGGLWSTPFPLTPVTDVFALGWCGRVALVLAIAGVLLGRRARALPVVLVVYFTLLPAVPLFVKVGWYVLPPLRAVSDFGRLGFLSSFGIAVLACFGADATRLLLGSSIRWRPGAGRHLLPGVALVAVLVELLPVAAAAMPPWQPRATGSFFPATAAVSAARGEPGGWPELTLPISGEGSSTADPRFAWSGTSFWGATAHAAGIDSVGGYDSAVPSRSSTLVRILQGTSLPTAIEPYGGAFIPTFSPEWTRLDLLRRVGVSRLYVPPGVDMAKSGYERWLDGSQVVSEGDDGRVLAIDGSNRAPRLVGQVAVAESPSAALAAFVEPQFDWSRTVVLESQDGGAASTPPSADVGSVTSAARGSNSAVVDLVAAQDAWLVLPISYSNGWTASVDGRRVDVRHANYAFSAVRVPAGAHRVTIHFRPDGFETGVVASGAGLVLGFALGAYGVARRRR